MLSSDLHQVVESMRHGGVAIFPTDTVWGMGCSIHRLDAIHRFYQIKGREKNKPTAVLTGSVQQAMEYGKFSQTAKELANLYWPGALTIVVDKADSVPKEIGGKTGTVGLRYPNFALIEEMTKMLGCGIVTGSANFAGELSPTSKELVDQRLRDSVDIMFDGECGSQPPSTVVDATGKKLNILRQGSVEIINI